MVIPTLNSNMNSTNGMIAGSASVYGAGSVGTDFGGNDVEASGTSFNCYRSLNGWIMKALSNAGEAWQSNGTSASTDDGTFHWPTSVKRGMIFRVAIGPEASTHANVARDLGGTISRGSALYQLRLIKQVGYGNNDSDAKIELHDGDLFQVVTTPASGNDDLAHCFGNEQTYPRLMYVGSLSGRSTAHNSTNAYVPSPAWGYAINNDSSVLSRISLSGCPDADFDFAVEGDDSLYTHSDEQATGAIIDVTDFNKRITSIDLADYIKDTNFEIGTIAECMSTNGEGGIAGRTNLTKPHSISSTSVDATNLTSTFTIASGHNYIKDDWITIAGAHSDYNGNHKILSCNATTVTISSSSAQTPSSGTITNISRNYYAGHGKLWVTSNSPHSWHKVYLIDVVNWHGLDSDKPKITFEEITLSYNKIHQRLTSDEFGYGLIEENYFDGSWVDREWTPTPSGGYISSICETYSCRPHLDDGAYGDSGKGRWRVWFQMSRTDNSNFSRWDLFLYNTRPTDLCLISSGVSGNQLFMYDKTPPYQELYKVGLKDSHNLHHIWLSRDKMLFSGTPVTLDDYWGNYLEYMDAGETVQGYTTDPARHYTRGWTDWRISGSGDGSYYLPDRVLNPASVYDSRAAHIRSPGTHFILKDANHSEWDTQGKYNTPANGNGGFNYNGTQHSLDYAKGGPMFRDPSGYWHVIELGLFSGYGNGFSDNNDTIDNLGALRAINQTLHLGYNMGWDKDNVREINPARHTLKPFYHEWYKTTGVATESNGELVNTDTDVAHIVTSVAKQSGKFIYDAGTIFPEKSDYGNHTNGYNTAWNTNVDTNKTTDFNNTIVLLTQHDSLVAFTSSNEFGDLGGENDTVSDLDGVTNWSNTSGTFTDATCDYNNDPTIACDANASIKPGMSVSGTGIPTGAYVASVNTPGAVTSFELMYDTGQAMSTTGGTVTNGTLTFSKGIIEIQSRTSGELNGDNAHTYMTGDKRADFLTTNGVQATLGYSKFNQYRYGHDNNGTHDLETDAYTSSVDDDWNTWNSYIGQDGFGHFNMVTTSMNSIGDLGAASFEAIATPHSDGSGRNGWKRMRGFNMYFDYPGSYDYPEYHYYGTKELGLDSTNGQYWGGEGTGYFTWYANHDGLMGSTTTNGEQHHDTYQHGYVNTGGNIDENNWNGYERAFYHATTWTHNSGNVDTDTYTMPHGTPYSNRRVVFCNSCISKVTGLGRQGVKWSKYSAPRTTFQELDGFLNWVPMGDDEKNKFEKITNVDNIVLLDNDPDSKDTGSGHIASGLLFQGTALDNQGESKFMAQVSIPGNRAIDLVGSPPVHNMKKNWSPIRSYKQSNSEMARRMYPNQKILIKNLCHGLGSDTDTDGDYNDIYSPIITGDNKDNSTTQINIWKNENFEEMGTSQESIAYPHYTFDKFFNSEGVDSNAWAGLDNAGNQTISLRWPTEENGSTVGYNEIDTSNKGTSYDLVTTHRKIYKTSSIETQLNTGSQNSEFTEGDILEYKFSFLYDGFQDSPLTDRSHFHNNGTALASGDGTVESVTMTILISNAEQLGLSKRVTDIIVWRRNQADDDFRFVEQINLDQLGRTALNEDGEYVYAFTDSESAESYLAITGVNQVLTDISVNYGLSTQVGDYLFVGNCYHQKINDAQNIIFRSQPGKFSIFDWSLGNILAMPSKPLAIKGFGGKLYVFSRETTYRVNPDDMYIESKMDGIGILDQKGVVVTDYGMFFCDANGMYMHDGTAPKTISGTVAYNQDYPEGSIGYKQALKKAVSKGKIFISISCL